MIIQIKTTKKEELIDITDQILGIIDKHKFNEGLCTIQSLHTTAGITINENADPDVKKDILRGLEVFNRNDYNHSEGNSPAHIKTSLMGITQVVPVEDQTLCLGRWQGIMFCEFDGPRQRNVSVTFIKTK